MQGFIDAMLFMFPFIVIGAIGLTVIFAGIIIAMRKMIGAMEHRIDNDIQGLHINRRK